MFRKRNYAVKFEVKEIILRRFMGTLEVLAQQCWENRRNATRRISFCKLSYAKCTFSRLRQFSNVLFQA